MSAIEYIALISVVLLSGLLAFYLKGFNKQAGKLILSFSGAYILGITFLHLLPETFARGNERLGLFILIGFFIQLILEQLSKGIEHGHIHAAHEPKAAFAISLMLGLSLHAFLEGMPLGTYVDLGNHDGHHHNFNHLLVGIIIHKIPAALALVSLMLLSGFKKSLTIVCLIIFAFMSPLGAFTTDMLSQHNVLNEKAMTAVLAIVIGSFLHISTTILFESENTGGHHHISLPKIISIVLGIGIAILTMHSH